MLCDVVANCPAQHRVPGFEGVEDGTLRDRTLNVELDLGTHMRQRSQMLRKYDADHVSVIILIWIMSS